ncbi:ABC-three component system protein [Pseudactinotalea sp. Z1739]|uniref:ABC-three component system protein n=1 Tax=Pseudactinotalea sp. Z1739 TaxID=3413028 RepID=UPI003C7DC742
MSSDATNRFSAAGSALGYLAQVEYALLIALQRMDGDVSLRLSLETVDDITFDVDGDARELWQTKHHVTRHGSLGDASPDFWKTLHNWIETADDDSACFLFTTVTAPADSAASLLGPGRGVQDITVAMQKLDKVASAAGNESSRPYYTKYLELREEQRQGLLTRVTVLDAAVDAATLTDALVGTVRKATTGPRRGPLIERLRGWWHGRAMTHLTRIAQGETDWIDLEEIEQRLLHIAQTLRDDNLPLDYGDVPQPTEQELNEDDRIFVEQLRIILLHHDRIRQAVYDHNRAFLQRSRWQREQLLNVGELDSYDRRLIEEWNRVFLPVGELSANDTEITDADKQRRAQELYVAIQQRDLPEIRRDVRSGYIPLGSLHILADRLQIGWHPDWVQLLRHRLNEVSSATAGQGAVA